jgi:hypothetical protein
MAPFHPESTLGLGAIELGIFATLLLFGMLVPQVYLYYLCNSDRTCVKLLVSCGILGNRTDLTMINNLKVAAVL